MLDGHEITSEPEQASAEDTAPDTAEQETTESAQGQNPVPSEDTASQAVEDDDESTIAEDDRGKRFVPEKRFKQIYAEKKELERQLEQLKTAPVEPESFNTNRVPLDRQSQLENELLFTQMPEFDPTSSNYSKALDAIAADIYRANGGNLTKLQAARMAKERASMIASKVDAVRSEARVVKIQNSDNGISQRNTVKESTPNLDNMSASELESYLKAQNAW